MAGGSSTVRVDIIQGRLDRTMPASLNSYMDPREWEKLANEIDRAMIPALRMQTCVPLAMVLWFVLSAAIMFASFRNVDLEDGPPGFAPFIAVPVLFFVLLGGIVIAGRITGDRVQSATQGICQRLTRRHNGRLSFHMKEEIYTTHHHHSSDHHLRTASKYSLEVVIANNNNNSNSNNNYVTTTEAPNYGPPTVFASMIEATPYDTDLESGGCVGGYGSASKVPSAPTKTELASVDRLTELEQIKHLLTEQEYHEKRQSILDSI